MQYEFKVDRLYLRRTPEERSPIIARLSRIEGQVRGIRQMIEEDRYCGDEVQQANAVTAAMREVAAIIISQHLEAVVQHSVENPSTTGTIQEMRALLRTALKL